MYLMKFLVGVRIQRKMGFLLYHIILGGEIVSTFGKPELVKIGKCDLIQQVNIGDETLIKFRYYALIIRFIGHYTPIKIIVV